MSRIDIVVFGASGFTGKYTVKHLIQIWKAKGSSFTWGIAGRNREKLLKMLNEISADKEIEVSKVPIIIADIKNEDSLCEMAKQTKVLLNCCGPYRFYGEPVVRACISNKTHHIDVSGEPQYMEKMQVNYHEKAKEQEVYVVSSCGFDSIPADLGLVFLKNEFKGELNSAEIFLDSWISGKKTGSTVHFGTWESAVYGVAKRSELRPLRKKLFPNPLPILSPKLKFRFPLTKIKELKGKWVLPFPGSDRSVIRRSQYFFHEASNERPVQVNTYVAFPNLLVVFAVLMAAAVFAIFSRWEYGRQLLLSYPRLFSLGFASHEGPPEDEAENTHFSFTLIGEGWKEKLAEPTDKHLEVPNKKLVVRVSGRNPGYGATCILMIVSGLMVLKEHDKMPNNGGVYPPAAAFYRTNMIKELDSLGIKFEVLSSSD